MSNPPPAAKTFRVAHRAPGETAAVAAGVVTIDAEHRIRVIAADPAFAGLLDLAAETLNESEAFMLRAAPQPGSPPLTLRRRSVPRTAPQAAEAVIEVLRRTYGLELTPAD
jgi:hypothetical protein